MLQIIIEQRQPKIIDFSIRKRYYERIPKLKIAHLITQKKVNDHKTIDEIGYEVIVVGSTVYKSLDF
jgi:hypothetical protein